MRFFKRFCRFKNFVSLRFKHNKYIALIVTFIVAIAASLLTVYFYSGQKDSVSNSQPTIVPRDFRQAPFDLNDAYDACLLEAKSSLGAGMLRAHMRPRSTRYEEKKGYYLVVINADVGNVQEWEEATIYCTVDPKAQQVSYYKRSS
ncbi:MAG: hypothetical protein ACJA0N_000810 [Pseudohongiellaceae bacterium]|jgi:hypothetical protein